MNLRECYEILEVEPGASPAEIHRAYKRLAMRHHPDRVANSAENQAMFCRITEAHALLKAVRPWLGTAKSHDHCATCGDFGEVFRALDGNQRCPACLLAQRRKRLPLPPLTNVRCITSIILQAIALGLLIQAVRTGGVTLAAFSVAILAGALVALTFDVTRSNIVKG